MFSTGFSSGDRDGSRMMVRFFGTLSLSVLSQPGLVLEPDLDPIGLGKTGHVSRQGRMGSIA